MKRIHTFTHSMGHLCMILVFVLSFFSALPIRAFDWEEQGTTNLPAGNYYLYNPNAGVFLKATNEVTANPDQATLFYISGTSSTLKYNTNKYVRFTASVNLLGSVSISADWGNTTQTWTIESKVDNHYTLKAGANYWYLGNRTATRYLSTDGTNVSYDASTSDNTDWVFISQSKFDELKVTVYYVASVAYADNAQSSYGSVQVSDGSTSGSTIDHTSGVTGYTDAAVVNVPITYTATPTNSNYRFLGWKMNPDDPDYFASDATLKTEFVASTNPDEPTQITLYAVFQRKETIYYASEALVGNEAVVSEVLAAGGSIKTSFTNTSWGSRTATASGNVASFNNSENITVYYQAAKPSGDTYQFLGWKNEKEDNSYVSTNTSYSYAFTAGSHDSQEPTSTHLYAYFGKKKTIYAKVETGIGSFDGGTAKVSFTSPIAGDNTSATTSIVEYNEDHTFTGYFSASVNEGNEFVGWSRNPEGTQMISGAYGLEYQETFVAYSTDATQPTTLSRYAIFEPISDKEAQVIHVDDEGVETVTKYDLLSEAVDAAGNEDVVQILKHIAISSSIAYDADKETMLDLNGFSLTSAGTAIVVSNGKLTIADNKPRDNSIRFASAVSVPLISVTNGTLTLASGRFDATDSSVGAISVTGGEFISKGAGAEISASSGYGIDVSGAAKLTLAQGTVTVTGNDAVGVRIESSGKANITHSIKINAPYGVRINHANADVMIDGGVITATTYAIQAQNGSVVCGGNMEAKATATSGSYAIKQEGNAEVTVNTGRFYTGKTNVADIAAQTASKLVLKGGYYTNDEGLDTYRIKNTNPEVRVAALTSGNKFYAAGYRYVLSDGENPNYIAYTANNKNFSSLEDALDYANQNSGTTMTIRQVVPEYELPAGNYTLPVNATLLIPYEGQTAAKTSVERIKAADQLATNAYTILRMKQGANLSVLGKVEVGSKQNVEGQGERGIGRPVGTYGQIIMAPGSHMTLSSNTELRAWGYITGDGSQDSNGKYLAGDIDVRRGATVREQFQIQDWKGGSCSSGMIRNTNKVFPVTQYFIQNVEVPTKYHPGAKLVCSAGMYVSGDVPIFGTIDATPVTDAIGLIGVRYSATNRDDAMFLMNDEDASDDTWVLKWYDVQNDKQVYEVNNSAELGNLAFDLSAWFMEVEFNSVDYILPLTSNMKIHLRSGSLDIAQSAELLPGAEVEVDKEATVKLSSGVKLFLYDADQWYGSLYGVESGNCISRVKYRPGGRPNIRPLKLSDMQSQNVDAKINVHGSFDAYGALYTTTSGAQISSTLEDAGTINFLADAPADGTTASLHQVNGISASSYDTTFCVPAKLLNSSAYAGSDPDKKFESIAGKAAYTSLCFLQINQEGGHWMNLTTIGCFVVDDTTTPSTYYAKPADYVAVTVQRDGLGNAIMDDILDVPIGNDDHTYSSAADDNPDRKFILLDNCQWWEVERVEEDANLFHCIHPDNDKYYYYWDDNRQVYDAGSEGYITLPGWVEKRYTVTWNNWNGTKIADYKMVYKSIPAFQGATPTRPMDTYYTYTFVGWTPDITPVLNDIAYTAQFQQNDRKYVITFEDEDGSTIESQYCKMGDVPVCYNMPEKDGMRLVWDPLIVAVTGEATYRATFTAEEKATYTITFIDYDGHTLQSSEVYANALPEYDESNGIPSKPSVANSGVAFEWDGGWTPEIVAADGDAIYSPTFRQVAVPFNIRFFSGNTQLGATQSVNYGNMPTIPDMSSLIAAYQSENPLPEGQRYEAAWTPQIAVAVKNQDYYLNGYVIRNGKCSFNMVAGDNGNVQIDYTVNAQATSEQTTSINRSISVALDYGTNVTISALPEEHYRFVRWSDGNTNAVRADYLITATTLTAEFAPEQIAITWDLDNGKADDVTMVNYNTMPSHTTPVKDPSEGYTYSFAGWEPALELATEAKTYKAVYDKIPNTYNVRFVYNNGSADYVKAYENTATPVITNPVKSFNPSVDYVFVGWKSVTTGEMTPAGTSTTTLPPVYHVETYSAQYSLIAGAGNEGPTQTLSISENEEVNTLTIHSDGQVSLNYGVNLTIGNLYIEATESSSGELIPINATASATNAYYDLTLDTWARHWHAFGVPWTVDIGETPLIEVKTKAGVETSRVLTMGRDYDILYYDGAVRAQYGPVPACWKYVNDEAHVLTPGRVYMIAFTSPVGTLRFAKKAGTSLLFSETLSVAKNTQSTGNTMDGGWNGIANPMTYHAVLNAGVTECQVYDSDSIGYDNYSMVNLTDKKFIVGKAVYVQVGNSQNVGISQATTQSPFAAPRRQQVADETDNRYDVHIAPLDGESADHIYVVSDENKEEDTYTIVADLAKFGMSTRKAHIWVNRYETRLAKNTIAPINGHADYPLGLYAPNDGEYTISLTYDPDDDQTMYLTLDGEAIWNISDSPYTLTLNKGIVNNYGLRIRSNAPQVITGMDEAIVDANGETRKVMINNQVYIIRGENVYTIDGQLVK